MLANPNVHSSTRSAAKVTREATRLSRNLDGRYEKSPILLSGVSAGHNQVQINGSLYPAEGIDGQGGAVTVTNVGTPAVARYAPPNNKSVIALAGSGRGGGSGGGGGSGATTLDALTDVTLSSPLNGQVLTYDSGSGQWVNSVSGGGAMIAHDLSGAYHTGLLNWALINFAGSNLTSIATRLHASLQGMTANDHHNQVHALVGSDHTAAGLAVGQTIRATSATTFAWAQLQHTDLGNILPDQHHNQVHVMTGPDHTASGLTAGYTLRAYGPTQFQWDQLQHNDLGGITPNQHHNQVHNITGSDHTISGVLWQVVGATAVNTLGLVTAIPNPGPVAGLLRTDNNGGIQLDTDVLYVDGANNWVGINRTPNGAAMDIQAAATAQISQRIRQLTGQTGRLWRIESDSGQELIVLDSVGNLQSGSPGFVSGLTGWQITPQGNAEFNNIWARGELHATVFVKDEVHATGGSLLVATAGVLHDDAVINSGGVGLDQFCVQSSAAGNMIPLQIETTSATFTGTTLYIETAGNLININDPPSGPALYFQPNEILRVKTEIASGISDLWLEVNSGVQQSGYSTYRVAKRSGTDATIPKGAAVVSYGLRGQGRILLTSDWRNDAEKSLAPYIDVFTTGQNPWAGGVGDIVPRVRMGQLAGVGVSGVSGISQWGMIASDDLSNTNAGYIIASNLGVRLYKVPLILNDGSVNTGSWTADGNLRVGKNVDADATTGFRVETTGANAGDVWIGNSGVGSLNYLHWVAATGTLVVAGSLQIAGDSGSAYATVAYVNSGDNTTLTSANTYTNTQFGATNTYANARRVIKVTGAWTSGVHVIAWSGVVVHFADGTSKALAASTGYALPYRIYLYTDITLAAPMAYYPLSDTDAVTNPNYVLLAVLDRGDPKASVTVVAGSTYISGANIYTGSIVANNMAINSIYSNSIVAGEVHASHLAADVITSFGNTRGIAVEGRFEPSGTVGTLVSWTGIRVKKATGAAPVSIVDNASNLTARTYFYILNGDLSGTAMRAQTDISLIPADAIMIAVCDPGPTRATVVMINGGLLISGDSIVANSITAGKIVAHTITANEISALTITANELAVGAVTATKINVSSLSAVQTNTGSLNVTGALSIGGSGINGAIYSAGKTTWTNTTPGFFLGWDTSLSVNAFKFYVGDSVNYISWNGSSLSIAGSTSALSINGNVVVSNGGAIMSQGKPSYESTVAGFFIGWHPSSFTYRLNIGDANHYIQWDSAQLNIAATGLFLNNATGDNLLGLATGGYAVNFDVGPDSVFGSLSSLKINYPIEVHDGSNNLYVRATKLINQGDTMRIVTPRTIAHFGDTPLNAGEICWDANFLYVCVGGSGWRRIAWTSSSW